MGHVGVERRAKEGQTARHGRLHVRAKPHRPPRHFRHAWETTIELNGVEGLAIASDEIHHRSEHGVLRMALDELIAEQIVALLFRRCPAPHVNYPIFRYPGGPR